MTINLGVKALLSWVKSIKLYEIVLTLDDLKDGAVLLEIVCMLKKEPNSGIGISIEERFKVIADFVERDCRFSSTKGTSLSWDNIRAGINLTIEIAKVLLLLLYHDIMNDRLTLNMLECEVEREIANLTGSFVMEKDGCVYFSERLDAHLARKHLPVAREIFERSATTSTSKVSSISSFSDDESSIFHRTQKVTFVNMQTVASSSVSKSPLQEIMNTPKFQLRKMKRQMITEREQRDGLERELSSKLELIAQRESHINQLQYRLDKMKEEQGDQENSIREQLNELQTKNDMLHIRLNEVVKENKDFKSNSSLMERKVDELSDENGVLSSQVRTMCSQRAIFEAEIGRLTETQAFTQDEWRSKTGHLQNELNKATTQKEILTEHIEILQGKLSYLEDEMKRATEQEVGENMGPVMEREMLDTEINGLKNELESTFCSLKKAEVEIEAKIQQLAEYQQEINHQKELLKQQEAQTEAIIQAKDDIFDKLEKEITEQRAVIQQEIQDLKIQLEQVEQQKTEQMTRLQQQIAACEQEIKELKEIKKEKEGLLLQTEENVKYLETKLSAASSLLADKDQQIDSLRKEVSILTDKTQNNQNEIQNKEEMLATLLLEKSNEQDVFCNKIQSLRVQVEDLSSSLKQAEQEIQLKQDLLAKTQQENVQQREVLQQQIVTYEVAVQKLNKKIQVKNKQLVILKKESSQQSELLEQAITDLKSQREHLNDSLRKAEDQVQTQKVMLTKQEQQSAHQTEALQQQLSASEERVRSMNEEIQTREEQMIMLKNQSSQQSELLHEEIQELKKQVECLSSSLKNAESNLQSKDDLFAEQQLQSTRDMESLQTQMVSSQDMVTMLNTEIHAKEEQLILLKTETSSHSEMLQQEIESLNKQIECVNDSLEIAKDQARAKEDLMAKQEQESTLKIETLEKRSAALEEEVQTKEREVDLWKVESCKESQVLHNEIQTPKDQVQSLNESLKKSIEQVQAKENLLTQKEMEISQEKAAFENMITTQKEKESLLLKAEEKLQILQTELSAVNTLITDKDQILITLGEQVADLIQKAMAQSEANEKLLAEMKEESSNQTDVLQHEIQCLKGEMESALLAKEQQLVSINAELNQYKETKAEDLRLKEAVYATTIMEKDALAKEKEVLMSRIFQSEKNLKALEKQLEAMVFENDRLAQANQGIEMENTASQELGSVLQHKLEILKLEKGKEELLKAKENAEKIETLKRDLQEQLSTKSVATEHYKAQMEKAQSHYNGKKQLLQESHGEVVELKHSLEVKEQEVKATTMQNQLLQLDLDKAQTNEKALLDRVANLEAQLAFADRNLREQNKIHGYERSAAGSCYLEVPFGLSGVETRAQVKRTVSSDSQDQSSLEDSLNNTRTSTGTGQRIELDSTCRNPTSSVKRRRTTQVINITMTKKTPGSGEDDETFYSLASARSQPNLASAHSARPVPLASFDTPARMTSAASDQLIGLPGYRRSTILSQTASTFCAGVENEPEGAPDDWRRIAELQARNKACLPHLKSSYPVESGTGRGSTFLFTDEELRTGEPSDTFRRAATMPGQLQDSLASHRHSFMVGHSGAAASTRSHRLSLMPGQLTSITFGSSLLKGTKRASSTWSVNQTSPEKKVKASCFPRPLTPKNKISEPSSSQLYPALSPADRRQSMVFSIDNTPKNSNYLKKGLKKLRSSTRKSPGKSLKKSPTPTSSRNCKENIHAGVVRGGRIGSSKSPQVASKAQRATSRSAMFPLTANARKMMSKLKV